MHYAGKDSDTERPVYLGESVDIRSRRSIQTDHGEVFIRWKLVRDPLRSSLRKLAKFAEKHRGATLSKILG